MGRKYASIHIFTDEQEKVLLKLKNCYYKGNSMETTMHLTSNIFNDVGVQQIFERFANLWVNEVLIVQSESFVSIYDESLSFELIEEKAQSLSGNIGEPIIYTSNFDDDVFIFGIFRAGKLITGGKIGKCLPIYGIDPEIIDIDKFCSELSIKKTSSLESINTTDEIDVIEDEIEKLLKVSLELTICDIQSESEHYIESFIENRLYVYKKLKTASNY